MEIARCAKMLEIEVMLMFFCPGSTLLQTLHLPGATLFILVTVCSVKPALVHLLVMNLLEMDLLVMNLLVMDLLEIDLLVMNLHEMDLLAMHLLVMHLFVVYLFVD